MADADDILNVQTGQRKKTNIFMFVGLFFLTYLINCAVIYFVLKNRYDDMYSRMQAQADSAALAAADSMDTTAVDSSDTLMVLIEDSLLSIDITVPGPGGPAGTQQTAGVLPDTIEDTSLVAESYIPTAEDSARMNEQRKKVARLVRIVDKMKPVEAAKIFANLDDEFVMQILLRMKERNAAKVLTEMPASRAARLTSKIGNKTSG